MTALRTTVGQHAQQQENIAITPTVATPAWGSPPAWEAPSPAPNNIYLNHSDTNPYTPPPASNFAPTIPTPATAGIPPQKNASGGRGRGGRRGGRGCGGSLFNKNQSAYGREPPSTGVDAAVRDLLISFRRFNKLSNHMDVYFIIIRKQGMISSWIGWVHGEVFKGAELCVTVDF